VPERPSFELETIEYLLPPLEVLSLVDETVTTERIEFAQTIADDVR
jgi:hypothetical protein